CRRRTILAHDTSSLRGLLTGTGPGSRRRQSTATPGREHTAHRRLDAYAAAPTGAPLAGRISRARNATPDRMSPSRPFCDQGIISRSTTSTGSRHCSAGTVGDAMLTAITVDPSSSFVNPVNSTDHTGQFVDASTFCTPFGPVF